MKKQLSRREEFEVLKIVLDKIFLLGFAIMAYGGYLLYNSGGRSGFSVLVVGAAVLLVFTVLLVREYEMIK
jgi:hypothetical protein